MSGIDKNGVIKEGVKTAVNEFNFIMIQTTTLLIISIAIAMFLFWIADKYTEHDGTTYKILMKLSETFMLLSTIALSGVGFLYFSKIKSNGKKIENIREGNTIYCQNLGRTLHRRTYYTFDID